MFKKIIIIMLLLFVNIIDARWGGYNRGDYKTYYHHGRHNLVHRRVYEKNYGKIPKGSHIHHKLDNRPQNLQAMTPKAHRHHHKIHRQQNT